MHTAADLPLLLLATATDAMAIVVKIQAIVQAANATNSVAMATIP